MPDKKLLVIGDGPEMKTLKAKETENIRLLGQVSFLEMIKYLQKAKTFIFAAEEDFGIVPVEAQACGTPVLAFGKGGALETVKEGVSGSFFYSQSVDAIVKGIIQMDKIKFNPKIGLILAER